MTRIVSGSFPTLERAEEAVKDLHAAGFTAEQINLFFNPPPGQHGAYPIGGDEHADPEARGAEKKTLTGAAIGAGIGMLAGAVGGPIGAAAGAAVGGYTGSLAGTLNGLGNDGEAERRRKAGVVVAVRADSRPETELVSLLEHSGADSVESVEGEWRGGEWSDYDAVEPPRPAGGNESRGAAAEAPRIVYRVFPGGHGRWNVFEGDMGKLLSEFPERQEALDYAESLARMKNAAVIEVYRAGGILESSRAYSSNDRYGMKSP